MDHVYKIRQILNITWECYCKKVSSLLYRPENEKMMQLQLALILQTVCPLFEYEQDEAIKILLEEPVYIKREPSKRIIDIVILHTIKGKNTFYPIELKFFRKYARGTDNKPRGAQNLGMYDYWADIENIEQYSTLNDYGFGTHFAITDDEYYVSGKHRGNQVEVYSTNIQRTKVSGLLEQAIVNRKGQIELIGSYNTTCWTKDGPFYFIRQESRNTKH